MEGLNVISLDGGSYFFNLNILANLMLQKKEKIESKPTFVRWIWNTLKDLGEVICITGAYEEEILGNEKTVEISHKV